MRGVLVSLFCAGVVAAQDVATLAERQQWDELSAAIAAKADVNQKQADGATALHWAAYHDRADAVDELLAAGAEADEENRYELTPLLLACENGSTKIVSRLLKAGANANESCPGGASALMVASRTGVLGPVLALIEAGAKVDDKDSHGQDALIWAAAAGYPDVVSALVKHGAKLDQRLSSGFTPLLFAAREGKMSTVQRLLERGANVHDAIETEEDTNGRDAPKGTSAVLLALENGYYELAQFLIQSGVDPDDMRSGFTALHTLTWVRRPPRGDDEAGQPPPDTHGRLSSLDLIRALVKAGANVNKVLGDDAKGRETGALSFRGATPFLLAARNADLPMMKLLVELGADPHLANEEGSTPLMAAAGLGCRAPDEEAGTEDECVAVCEYLLSLGAKVDAVDKDGNTAMHGAALKSLPKVVQLLTRHGARAKVWHQKNDRGWTPLLIAQGFRPGNFKPSVPTVEAISAALSAEGITPPPAHARESLPKPKGYQR
jgi:uncharacterized protein